MIIQQRLLIFVFLMAILLVGLSCSDNPTDPESNTPGESSVEVSGTIEGEHMGWALFNMAELPFDTYSWSIEMTDNTTFSLSLNLTSNEPLNRPGPGTYTIGPGILYDDLGRGIGPDPTEFTAIFTDIASGGIGAGADYEYATLHEETTGTVVIEESSNDVVSGHFYFNGAGDIDENGNIIDPITAEGEFRAVNQESVN